MSGVEPFHYPAAPHCRKHGPSGYADYADYKDWLRDEFDFRCVYCLRRESWERRRAIWVVEHLVPRKLRPDLATHYPNLVLACTTCNSVKSASTMPDPCKVAYAALVSVREDGTIHDHSPAGRKLIKGAGLGDADATEWRRKMIHLIRNYRRHEPHEYRRWMGYPDDLPDLSRRKSKPNSKPRGAAECRYLQQIAGKLPPTY